MKYVSSNVLGQQAHRRGPDQGAATLPSRDQKPTLACTKNVRGSPR